jgi:hypothetical protein
VGRSWEFNPSLLAWLHEVRGCHQDTNVDGQRARGICSPSLSKLDRTCKYVRISRKPAGITITLALKLCSMRVKPYKLHHPVPLLCDLFTMRAPNELCAFEMTIMY